MCHFITLIAPTDNAAMVRAVMERHGRTAEPVDNPAIRKVLRDGERQYLTTQGACDCGTVLAPPADTVETPEEKLRKEADRMRRKGWSEAKIARATKGRRTADSRQHGKASDSIALWTAVLGDLRRDLKLPYAGLLVKFYSGEVATEVFNASRRDIARTALLPAALGSMKHDEVTIFPLG